MSGPVLLAFSVWMLLTSEFTWANAAIGLAGSVVASLLHPYRFSAWQFMELVGLTVLHLPQAIWETALMVCVPHRYEKTAQKDVRNPENPWSVFCQTFIITLTPRTLVISEEKNGKIRLHLVSRKGQP
jgi:multicomponent Na+:H+ antiporter subunit E